MKVEILVNKHNEKAFQKRYPQAVKVNDFVFKLDGKTYMQDMGIINQLGSLIQPPKCTNYVKITGQLTGQPFKLFVRETQVYKVLSSLEKRNNSENEIHYRASSLSVTMRKVKIANAYNDRLKPIVLKSLAYVGIAA